MGVKTWIIVVASVAFAAGGCAVSGQPAVQLESQVFLAAYAPPAAQAPDPDGEAPLPADPPANQPGDATPLAENRGNAPVNSEAAADSGAPTAPDAIAPDALKAKAESAAEPAAEPTAKRSTRDFASPSERYRKLRGLLGYDSQVRLASNKPGTARAAIGREAAENINVASLGSPEAAPARVPGTLRTASRDDLLQSLSGIFPSLGGTNIFVPSRNPVEARCGDLISAGFFSTPQDCRAAFNANRR